jgi:hypothetical protein
MPKYEAVINVTAVADCANEDEADKAFLGELTSRLLEVASRDNKYQLWVEVLQIEEES